MTFKPTPVDGYPTPTSNAQLETENTISALLTEAVPQLDRNVHVQFLGRALLQGLPVRYQSQDASKAWIMFWILQSFSLLGVGLDPVSKQRAIDTIIKFQHPDGGFGGGPQQFPHILATYASVLALAIVGRPGPGGGWDDIDREKLYKFFMSLKQPDGSFIVSRDSEVDIRGIYCLLVVATLLDIIVHRQLPNIRRQRCWRACASSVATATLGEAHGGYSYCAIASWALLRPFLEKCQPGPASSPTPQLDLRLLMRWLASMQGTEIDLGGFRGRTNKLVDGCYSWWVGAEFPLVEWLSGETLERELPPAPEQAKDGDNEDWQDVEDGILNKRALQQFILFAAQASTGGLRDKPGKNADAYHTLYNLSGLSSAQHHFLPSDTLHASLTEQWNKDAGEGAGNVVKLGYSPRDHEMRKTMWVEMSSWVEDEHQPESQFLGGKKNRLNAIHPILTLTMTHFRGILNHFYGQSSIVYV
ncbi:terpenoid cyclases/Protein prenyltransferase [Auriculariales sp. MPI-PUGE-AT-0066]|nr:terpenoid cyclases/Protein prenyltransferase [Auriculariales sp. MPI-PUGE-AT-0066]